jgi:hypothetical protein
LAGVVGGVHLGIGGSDLAFFVNQVADTHGVTSSRIPAGTIAQANFAIGIAEQLEWEAVLTCKRQIRGSIVEAHAKNDDASALETIVLVAEPATLSGSTGCVGLGIKPQKNLPATQRRQRQSLSLVRGCGEVWGGFTNVKHQFSIDNIPS